MTPYFSDDRNWNNAKSILDSWMGTPYRHLWMKKGRGADCSLFIGAILLELGIIREVKHDFYPPDWYRHSKVETILNGFADHIRSTMVPGFSLIQVTAPLMRGDMPTFSTVPATGATNHAGILLDPPTDFVHSIQHRGVSEMHWGNCWERWLTTTYRVVC